MFIGETKMRFLSIARLIVSLMPILITAIKSAEEALPESGKGALKLAMVRGVLESAYSAATDTEATFDEVWPSIKRAVDAIVAAFNAAKIFKK
jgi:hypothetical protein